MNTTFRGFLLAVSIVFGYIVVFGILAGCALSYAKDVPAPEAAEKEDRRVTIGVREECRIPPPRYYTSVDRSCFYAEWRDDAVCIFQMAPYIDEVGSLWDCQILMGQETCDKAFIPLKMICEIKAFDGTYGEEIRL